ncbi:MAG: hypothetical protein QM610_03295 [Chitinophagaceae bacterium]
MDFWSKNKSKSYNKEQPSGGIRRAVLYLGNARQWLKKGHLPLFTYGGRFAVGEDSSNFRILNMVAVGVSTDRQDVETETIRLYSKIGNISLLSCPLAW